MRLITNWAFSAIVAISAAPGATGIYRAPRSAHEVMLARNYGAPNNTADDASTNPPDKATNNAADDTPSDAANNAAAIAAQPPNIDDAAVFPNQGTDGVPELGLHPLRDGSVVPLTPGNDPSAAPAAPPEDGSIGFPDSAAALTAKFPNESGSSGAAFPNAAKDSTASFGNPSDPADEYEGMANQTMTSQQTPGEADPAQDLPKNLQQVPANDGGNSFDPQETSLDRGYGETSAASPSKDGRAQKRQPPTDGRDKATAMEGSLPQDDLSQQNQPSGGDELGGTDPAAPSSLQDAPQGEEPSTSDGFDEGPPATENGDK